MTAIGGKGANGDAAAYASATEVARLEQRIADQAEAIGESRAHSSRQWGELFKVYCELERSIVANNAATNNLRLSMNGRFGEIRGAVESLRATVNDTNRMMAIALAKLDKVPA